MATAKDYQLKAADLKKKWITRNSKFLEWYKLLRLDDELKAEGMESFTANDPRTLYNLALFLLTPDDLAYNIPLEGVSVEEQSAITQVEQLVTKSWWQRNLESRSKGQQSWLRRLVSLMLATGWYSVFTVIDAGELVADIWNPAEVYPDFDDGLSSVAHCYTISASGARRKARNNNWNVTITGNQPVEVIDYWEYNDNGDPENTIIMGSQYAKPPTAHPDLVTIPVLCSPVNGLPDTGAIDGSPVDWQQHIGESILATNEGVYKNYNRLLTFLLQIVRDTAQPRIIERSKGASPVVTPANWNRRGAIFKLDIDEAIETLAMPGVPPELSTQVLNMQGMIQRGGFAYSLFGNVSGDVSGYAQTLGAAAANQILKPYADATSYLLSDICNRWLDSMPKPTQFPVDARFKVELKVQIPGDLIQRATTARQLDPTFKLSDTTTMDMLFPEIRDPNREMVLGRRDLAMRNPVMATLDLIGALTEQADALEAEGNNQQAQLYRQAAQAAQAAVASPGQSTEALNATSPYERRLPFNGGSGNGNVGP